MGATSESSLAARAGVDTVPRRATSPWVFREARIIRQPADRADRAGDQTKVEQILGELSKLSAEKLWSEKPSERELERYGLRTPKLKATVVVKDGDKTTERIYSFGNETEDKSGIYARQSERDLVFVVRKDAITNLETADIQDREIYRIARIPRLLRQERRGQSDQPAGEPRPVDRLPAPHDQAAYGRSAAGRAYPWKLNVLIGAEHSGQWMR